MDSGLSPELVKELMDQGMKQAAIAREYGVTRQWVNILARRAGHEPIVTKVDESMPWVVDPNFFNNTIYRSLRLHGHFTVGGPEAITGASVGKLKGFYRKLIAFNQVVDYNPDYPAIPNITNTPGFAYVPRTSADEDYIIKIRPGVNLTTEGKKIWRLPKQLP